MRRTLFNIGASISLLVFVASLALSVGQHFANASVLQASHGIRYELTSADGAVDLARFSGWKPTNPIVFVLDAPGPGERKRLAASQWGPLGVGWHPAHFFGAVGIRLSSGIYVPPFSFRYMLYNTQFYLITIPNWLLMMVPMPRPVAWIWRWSRRRARSRRGFAVVLAGATVGQ